MEKQLWKKNIFWHPIYKKIKIFFISWKMLFIKSFPKSHVLLKLMVTRIFKCGNCHGIFTQFFFLLKLLPERFPVLCYRYFFFKTHEITFLYIFRTEACYHIKFDLLSSPSNPIPSPFLSIRQRRIPQLILKRIWLGLFNSIPEAFHRKWNDMSGDLIALHPHSRYFQRRYPHRG